jgi:hypothetical protein
MTELQEGRGIVATNDSLGDGTAGLGGKSRLTAVLGLGEETKSGGQF